MTKKKTTNVGGSFLGLFNKRNTKKKTQNNIEYLIKEIKKKEASRDKQKKRIPEFKNRRTRTQEKLDRLKNKRDDLKKKIKELKQKISDLFLDK